MYQVKKQSGQDPLNVPIKRLGLALINATCPGREVCGVVP